MDIQNAYMVQSEDKAFIGVMTEMMYRFFGGRKRGVVQFILYSHFYFFQDTRLTNFQYL
ncbi:hypothetical protein SAMN05720765_104168 [Fibrobacter sp. UWH6]|nr:hypothetical protein SAMN05720765_104168 [Fibrobacter sp. UWH6]